MKKNKPDREVIEEIDLLDDMLSSLVDLLIEKGIISEEEYEKRIKEKVRVKRQDIRKQKYTDNEV